MDLGRFKAGDILHLHDGSRVEALAPSEDGRSVRVRYLDAPGEPSLVDTEDFGAAERIAAFTLAPPDLGPVAWGNAFKGYLGAIGVETGRGSSDAKQHNPESRTVRDVAAEAGVSEDTATRRMNLSDEYPALTVAGLSRGTHPGEYLSSTTRCRQAWNSSRGVHDLVKPSAG